MHLPHSPLCTINKSRTIGKSRERVMLSEENERTEDTCFAIAKRRNRRSETRVTGLRETVTACLDGQLHNFFAGAFAEISRNARGTPRCVFTLPVARGRPRSR